MGKLYSYKIGRKVCFTQDNADTYIARFAGYDYRNMGKIITEV